MTDLNRKILITSATLTAILGYRLLTTGPFDSMLYRILGIGRPSYPIKIVNLNSEYSEVYDQFIKHFDNGEEVGASFVVYSGEEKVVELYGGYSNFENKTAYDESTVQQVASVSKNVAALVLSMLVDRGLISYDTKVSEIWPEFAQGNKENVTLEDVLKHQAGLSYFDIQPPLEAKYDMDFMAKYIAQQSHLFEGKRIRAYHGFTRGFILNEIVRRIDPKHRTLGQIYREELNPTAGVEFFLGLPNNPDGTNELIPRRAWWYSQPVIDSLFGLVLPKFLAGNRFPPNLELTKIINNKHLKKLSKLKVSTRKDFPNSPDVWDCEIPSSNLHTNAKSLAKLGAYLANKGTLNNNQLISSETFQLSISDPELAYCNIMQFDTIMTKGGYGQFTIPELGEEYKFYGWPGFGGSLLLFNPEYNFSIAYTCNAAHLEAYIPQRAKNLLVKAFQAHLKSKNI